MLKKLFRNGSADILVMISLGLVFVILFYLIPLFSTLEKIQRKADGYQYEKYFEVQFASYNSEGILEVDEEKEQQLSYPDFEQFWEKLEGISTGNIYLYTSIDVVKNVSFYTGKLLVKRNEAVLENFLDAGDEAAFAISPVLDSYVDGEYIQMGDVACHIDGYLTKSEQQICAFYADMEALSEEQREYFKEQIYQTFKEGSMIFYLAGENDISSAEEVFRDICGSFHAETEDVTEDISTQSSQEKSVYSMINKYTLLLCLMLAVVNAVNVTQNYVKRKTGEYAVRKAYGYTDMQILLINMKNMGKDFIIAIPAGLCVLAGIHSIEKHMFGTAYDNPFTAVQILCLLAAGIAVYFLTQWFALKRIMGIDPAAIIQSKND